MIRRSTFCLALTLAAVSAGHEGLLATGTARLASSLPLPARPVAVDAGRARAMLARIPLLFEKNAGQVDSRVAFLARTPAYSLFLTSDTATLVLDPGTPRRSATDSDIFPVATTRRGHVVRMRLAGASADVDIAGADARAARMHYAAGRDAKTWRTDVPTYGRVEYSGIYPGIDLVYYGHDGRLEYDFVIAPGASPSRIALDFDGVQRVTVNSAGDLVLDTRAGRLVQAKPVAYQEIAGERHEVDSAYVRTGPRSVGFRVGAYDTSAPLRIDPVLAYSTYLGGGGGGQAYGVAADAAGNVYLCGTGNSTSFPVTGNGVPLDDDMFVVKLTPDGQVGYAFTMAGNASDSAEGLAVDASGQVAVTGYSDSSNLPLMNAFLGDQPLRDSYVVKLDPDGNILFMTYIGGSLSDTGETVTFDPFGNIYAAGTTTSTDFPMLNALRSTSAALEGWIAKFDPSGNLLYSTYLGGSNWEVVESLQADAAGYLYAGGWTKSTDFPVLPAGQKKLASEDVFIAKLTPAGNALAYSRLIGGNNTERAFAVALDGIGGAYVGGRTESTNFPRVGSFQGDQIGTDAFLSRVDANGTVVFSTYLGGDGYERILGLAARDGQLFFVGRTDSTNFPVVNPIQATKTGTAGDAFVGTIDIATNTVTFCTYLGGSQDDEGRGVAPLPGRNVWVGGWTQSTDFPSVRAIQDTLTFPNNVMLARIAPLGVDSVSPFFGMMQGGEEITITGEAFQAGAAVLVGGLPATAVTFVDAQTLVAMTPAHDAGTVDITVVNPDGGSGTLYGLYQILATTGPVANAGPDQTVQASGPSGALVLLDGSQSFDPDHESLTYTWLDEANGVLGADAVISITLPIGTHTLSLVVSDGHSTDGVDTVIVRVLDNIAPSVSVVMPNTTNNIYTNTPVTLGWTASDNESGLASFDIFLSTDGGVTYGATPICPAVSGAARSCTWATPGPATTKGRIKVVAHDAAGNTRSDASDANFKIVAGTGSITVSAPNTAVNWGAGSSQLIKWSHNLGAGSIVRIDLSTNGGLAWAPVASSVVNGSTSGTYTWLVPSTLTNAARIRVSWNHGPVSDSSNANFTIATAFINVTAPKSGANWGYGTLQKPTWTTNLGAADRVEIRYSTDDGQTFPIALASGIGASAKSATITTPTLAVPTTLARVRVSWTNAPAGYSAQGTNPAHFKTEPAFVTVTAPNGGNVWTVGTNAQITWSHNLGALENVKIELSQDDGATFPIVVLGSTTSDGAQTVTVAPSWVTSLGRVRVSWVKAAAVADTSNGRVVVQ